MKKGVFQSLFFVCEQMMWSEIHYSSSSRGELVSSQDWSSS